MIISFYNFYISCCYFLLKKGKFGLKITRKLCVLHQARELGLNLFHFYFITLMLWLAIRFKITTGFKITRVSLPRILFRSCVYSFTGCRIFA